MIIYKMGIRGYMVSGASIPISPRAFLMVFRTESTILNLAPSNSDPITGVDL